MRRINTKPPKLYQLFGDKRKLCFFTTGVDLVFFRHRSIFFYFVFCYCIILEYFKKKYHSLFQWVSIYLLNASIPLLVLLSAPNACPGGNDGFEFGVILFSTSISSTQESIAAVRDNREKIISISFLSFTSVTALKKKQRTAKFEVPKICACL